MAAQPRDNFKGRDLDERFYAFDEKSAKKIEDENNQPEAESIYDLTESLLSDEESSAKNALNQLWDLKNRVESDKSMLTVDTLIEHFQNKIDLMRSKEKRIRTISESSRELLYEKMRSEKELKAVKSGILKCKAGIETLQMKLLELEQKESELSNSHERITSDLESNNTEVLSGLYEVVLSRNTQLEKSIDPQDPIIEDTIPEVSAPTTGYYLDEEYTPYPISKVTTKDGLIVSQYYMNKPQPETNKFIVNSRFFSQKISRLQDKVQSKSVKTELILSIRDMLKRTEDQDIDVSFEISLNEIMNPMRLHELEKAIVTADSFFIREFNDKLSSKLLALNDNYFTLLTEQMER